MTELEEKRVAIAKFMGYKPILIKPDVYRLEQYSGFITEGDNPDDVWKLASQTIKYDGDWNALMQVVEKVEETNQGSVVIQSKNLVTVSFGSKTYSYFSGTLIENTFNACALFIKYYSQK